MSRRTLGLVPARTGSKRVERKNLRTLGGKPLLGRAVEQALAADTLDTVVVSSDHEEMRSVAREYGASVPFERPAELATDEATNDEVVTHALDWFAGRDESFDTVCLVPATVPFREPADIDAAVRTLDRPSADAVVSVTRYDTPPGWAMRMEDGLLRPRFGDGPWEATRSQEYAELYHPNGAVFAADTGAFRAAESFYTDATTGYEMPRDRSLDIDEPFDLELARALLERRER